MGLDEISVTYGYGILKTTKNIKPATASLYIDKISKIFNREIQNKISKHTEKTHAPQLQMDRHEEITIGQMDTSVLADEISKMSNKMENAQIQFTQIIIEQLEKAKNSDKSAEYDYMETVVIDIENRIKECINNALLPEL